MNPKHFSSCLLAMLSYLCLVDGLQPDRFAELLHRGSDQRDSFGGYGRLSEQESPSLEDIEKIKTDLTVLAKLGKDRDNGVFDTGLDSEDFGAEPAEKQFLLESMPIQRRYEQQRNSKTDDDWNSLLNDLLLSNEAADEANPYLELLGDDITPFTNDALLQNPVYDNKYRSARYRSKRSFCDRYGNCGKRSGDIKAVENTGQSAYKFFHKGHTDKVNNDNLQSEDESDLTELYTSNEILPKLNTILGRKHISKKHSPSMSIAKRSLNRSTNERGDESKTIATKLNERVYDKIKQYCLMHECKIKLTRDTPQATENDLSFPNRNGDTLNVMSRLMALLKKSRLATQSNAIDGRDHSNAKRANPFCPPWGCGRRRRKEPARPNGLKHELRDLLKTRFLRLRNRKIRPKSINTSVPFDRQQRLSLFCPYGGCRGRH